MSSANEGGDVKRAPTAPRQWPEIVISLAIATVGGLGLLPSGITRVTAGGALAFGIIALFALVLRASYRTPHKWTLVAQWEVPPSLWQHHVARVRAGAFEAAAIIVGLGVVSVGLMALFTWLRDPQRVSQLVPPLAGLIAPAILLSLVYHVGNAWRRLRPATVWVYQEGLVIGTLVHAWKAEGSFRSVGPTNECDYPALEFRWVIGRRGLGTETVPIPTEEVGLRERILDQLGRPGAPKSGVQTGAT